MSRAPRVPRATGVPVALALLLALLVPTQGRGQAIYGMVTGVIEDTSAAGVPGATVVLTNEHTGLRFETSADGTGTLLYSKVT